MGEPESIEFFNAFTIALFDRLYASFPTPISINARDVVGQLLADEPSDSAWYQNAQAAGHAASFLADEGFITYTDARPNAGVFLGVRLTAKGLATLNATPSATEKHEPLIGRVRATVAQGAKAAGKEALHQLVQAILAAGIKAATS